MKLDGEGYYGEHYVTQHDLLKELAIYHSKLNRLEHRERLVIDICGRNFPKWWREQKRQVIKARLVSISTDGESSTLGSPNMHLPEAEVLVLNLRETQKFAIPEFVEEMLKLKLVITSEHFCDCQLSNFQSLSWLCNLKRLRLEGISISYIFKNSIPVKSLKKLSLIRCDTRVSSMTSVKFSHAFPNLEEMYIEGFLLVLLRGLRDLSSLKKLTISKSSVFLPLPDTIGKLVNLEVLRVRSLNSLSKLPSSIKNLKKLRFLGISECVDLEELAEQIGEMKSLRKMDIRSCMALKKLPQSILDLSQLEEVVCDSYT